MTDPHPLFEFMPYGAPELLDARRSHLLRALALASALAAIAFAIAHLGGWSVAPPPVIVPIDVLDHSRTVTPPPSILDPRPPRVDVVSPPAAGPAVPVPVAEPDVAQPPPVT